MRFFKRADVWIGGVGSLILLVAAWRGWLSLSLIETGGFVTGGLCVWLTVKENIWNWPLGLANNVFFAVLFWDQRLFADTALQGVYLVLGVLGWYWWLHGGPEKTELPVSRADATTIGVLCGIGIAATWGMTVFLQSHHDAAPFQDAVTTVLSLIAQYLITKKFIENWFVWIAADLIYIPLYAWKGLYLTAFLYAIFLLMCAQGLLEWKRSLQREAMQR